MIAENQVLYSDIIKKVDKECHFDVDSLNNLKIRLRNEEAKLILMSRIKEFNDPCIPGIIPKNTPAASNKIQDSREKNDTRSNDIISQKISKKLSVDLSKQHIDVKQSSINNEKTHKKPELLNSVERKIVSPKKEKNNEENDKVTDISIEHFSKKPKLDLERKSNKNNNYISENTKLPSNYSDLKPTLAPNKAQFFKDINLPSINYDIWPVIPTINISELSISLGAMVTESFLSNNDTEVQNNFQDSERCCDKCTVPISPFWISTDAENSKICQSCNKKIFFKKIVNENRSKKSVSTTMVDTNVQEQLKTDYVVPSTSTSKVFEETSKISNKTVPKTTSLNQNNTKSTVIVPPVFKSNNVYQSKPAQTVPKPNVNIVKSQHFIPLNTNTSTPQLNLNTKQVFRPVLLNLQNYPTVDQNITSFSKNINILHRPIHPTSSINQTMIHHGHISSNINRSSPNNHTQTVTIRPISRPYAPVNFISNDIIHNSVQMKESERNRQQTNNSVQIHSSHSRPISKVISPGLTHNNQYIRNSYDNHHTEVDSNMRNHVGFVENSQIYKSYSHSSPLEYDKHLRFGNNYDYSIKPMPYDQFNKNNRHFYKM